MNWCCQRFLEYICCINNPVEKSFLTQLLFLTRAETGLCLFRMINRAIQEGWTAISQAAHEGHADCVRLLAKSGADKNAKSNVRHTICLNFRVSLAWNSCPDLCLSNYQYIIYGKSNSRLSDYVDSSFAIVLFLI